MLLQVTIECFNFGDCHAIVKLELFQSSHWLNLIVIIIMKDSG